MARVEVFRAANLGWGVRTAIAVKGGCTIFSEFPWLTAALSEVAPPAVWRLTEEVLLRARDATRPAPCFAKELLQLYAFPKSQYDHVKNSMDATDVELLRALSAKHDVPVATVLQAYAHVAAVNIQYIGGGSRPQRARARATTPALTLTARRAPRPRRRSAPARSPAHRPGPLPLPEPSEPLVQSVREAGAPARHRRRARRGAARRRRG